MVIIITGPNENSPKAITGPNENSPKASISVNVMVANDQDGFYVEGTTRARPASTEENLYMRNTRNKNT